MALQGATPRDLASLRALLATAAGPVTYIAGGTDLLVAPEKLPAGGLLIDISQLGELSYVVSEGSGLRIGAGSSAAMLARNGTVRRLLPALARAAEACGSVQIRNRATIGGNIANAAPAADLLPVLKCADATFWVMASDGQLRRLSFDSLVLGSGLTALAAGELITEIAISAPGLLPLSGFVKLGRREDMTIARLNLVMQAEYRRDIRRMGEVRLAAGAIGPRPRRLTAVEDVLRGATLAAPTIGAYLEALVAAVDRAIPGRASQAYKRRAIMGLGLDLLDQVTGIGQAKQSIADVLA